VSAPRIILASTSAIRASVLRNAGVAIEVVPASIDEDAIKRAHRERGASADDCALALAVHKAEQVSDQHRDALVIGADQMLECDTAWFDKPADRGQAVAQLRALSAKTHVLVSAVAVVRNDMVPWRHVERARLTMRRLDDAFIAGYLDAIGDAAWRSVGVYQLEGRGAQLFNHIDGDHFAILGLPLLPLLGFLRRQGVVPT
jgi:septum formation protein